MLVRRLVLTLHDRNERLGEENLSERTSDRENDDKQGGEENPA
jgi:hypothetical protein